MKKPNPNYVQKKKIKCPKCNSTRTSIFLEKDKKGFKCLKCDYIWCQMRLQPKDQNFFVN